MGWKAAGLHRRLQVWLEQVAESAFRAQGFVLEEPALNSWAYTLNPKSEPANKSINK